MENSFQPIKNGFDNYLINQNGEVFSLKLKRKIKPFFTKGYFYYYLYKNKKHKNILLHRLLGYQFLGLTDDMCIDHINGIKTDNSLTNLRVCTRRDNNTFDNRKKFNLHGFQCVEKNKNGRYSVRIDTKFGRLRVGNQESIEDAKNIYFELMENLNDKEYLFSVKKRERIVYENKLLLNKKPPCNTKFDRFKRMIFNQKSIKVHSFERMKIGFYKNNKENISWRCKQDGSDDYLYSSSSLGEILSIKKFEIINNQIIIHNQQSY